MPNRPMTDVFLEAVERGDYGTIRLIARAAGAFVLGTFDDLVAYDDQCCTGRCEFLDDRQRVAGVLRASKEVFASMATLAGLLERMADSALSNSGPSLQQAMARHQQEFDKFGRTIVDLERHVGDVVDPECFDDDPRQDRESTRDWYTRERRESRRRQSLARLLKDQELVDALWDLKKAVG